LLSTEESYVKSLEIFIEVIAPVLKQDKASGIDAAILALVSNAEQVYTLNKKFLGDLQKMIGAANSGSGTTLDLDPHALTFAKLFLDYAPLFKIYAQYAKNHETGTNAIRKIRGTSLRLNKVILDAERMPICKGQSLWSFLIMPIQRVPRYVLLLKELQKRLPEDHPDKTNMDEAISKVGEVGDYLNEAIRKRENMEKISELETKFNGNIELLVPGRFIVKEAILKKLSHRGHLTEYQFHLFNDLLIYSKPSMQGLQLKQRIELSILSVERFERNDMIKEPVELGSAFKVTSPAVSFVVVAKNQKECDEWMEAIKSTVDSIDKNSKMKGSSSSFVSQFFGKIQMGKNNAALIASDLSMSGAAPVWVPDTEHNNCTICDSEFSFMNRKHHCRNWYATPLT
jgi:FYVE/RhoGEF/PH domain-containing protein 5/6